MRKLLAILLCLGACAAILAQTPTSTVRFPEGSRLKVFYKVLSEHPVTRQKEWSVGSFYANGGVTEKMLVKQLKDRFPDKSSRIVAVSVDDKRELFTVKFLHSADPAKKPTKEETVLVNCHSADIARNNLQIMYPKETITVLSVTPKKANP